MKCSGNMNTSLLYLTGDNYKLISYVLICGLMSLTCLIYNYTFISRLKITLTRYQNVSFDLPIELCSTCEFKKFKNRKCKLNKKERNGVTPP